MPRLIICPPSEHKLLVKPGDKLKSGDIIAQADDAKSAQLDVSKLLDINPAKLASHLLVSVNDDIEKDQLIAQKKGMFSSTTIKSPISGTIKLTDQPGSVLIKPKDATSTTVCPGNGSVEEVSPQGVILNLDNSVVVGDGGKGNTKGELIELKDNSGFYDIDDSLRGKVVASSSLTPAVLAKMKALKVAGIITDNPIESSALPYVVCSKLSEIREYTGKNVSLFNEGDNNYIVIE